MFGLGKTPKGERKTHRAFDLGTGPSGTPVTAGVVTGLVAGTRVATSLGWRAVEMVRPGDKVLTFDAGMQEVTHVTRNSLWTGSNCPKHLWPLRVPVDALGNLQEIVLLPGQSVMIESDFAEEVYGDPFTLVPGEALEGFHGIERFVPPKDLEVVTLHFARDQVVFTAAGALMFCPSVDPVSVHDLLHGLTGGYTVLDPADADFLIGCIEVEERRSSLSGMTGTLRAA